MAVIIGTAAAETLPGTAGKDTIDGAGGADTITMLGGNDLSLWSLGDGSDIVEGGMGVDTARFSSKNGFFNVSASGSGKVFVAAGVGGGAEILTLNDVEHLDLRAEAFFNTVTVGDLSGSDVTKVTVGFAGANDSVAAHASSANNTISVTTAGKNANITGLPTIFTVTNADASDVVEVHGANGNDKLSGATLAAGRIHISLHGDDGNDSLTGSVNDDVLDGGTGNDTVIGGRGLDQISLGAGNDLYLWTAGDGSDVVHGEGDFDSVRMTGSNDGEGFAVNLAGAGVHLTRFLGISPSIQQLDGIERIEIRTLGGADSVSVSPMTGTGVTAIAIDLAATAGGKTADTKVDFVDVNGDNVANTIALTTAGSKIFASGLDTELSIDHAGKTDELFIFGAGGNDIINASALAAGKMALRLDGATGDDTLTGSAGNDTVNDSSGNDVMSLGGGNDFIDWGSGHGDDTVDGGAGFDGLFLEGRDGALDIGSSLGDALLSRNDGSSVTMDGVERIEVAGYFGVPSLRIRDLTGLGIQQVAVDLSNLLGKSGNGETDSIGVNTTEGNDTIGATISGNVISLTGLASQLTIAHAESGDFLIIDSLGGDDVINMSKLPATMLGTSPRGGAGNDTLIGSANNDLLFGQEDNDRLTGGRGNDGINPGLGDDLVIWNDGDGSDSIFDEGGTDTLRFTGSATNDAIQLSSVGSSQFTLSRNVGAVLLSVSNVERVEIATLGGADTVNIGDLSSAGVTGVTVDLAATVGGKTADTKIDVVSIAGTVDNDEIQLSLVASKIVATGLPTELSVDHFGKTDRLVIHTGNGHDTIHANAIPAGKISLQLFGDDGVDLIFGSANGDIVEGGTGDDTAALGVGNDVFNWFEFDGSDVVVDQGGTDTFKAFGNSGKQNFTLSTAGGHLIFSSAVDGAAVDLDNVERVEITAAQDIDVVTVNNLAGSDAKVISIDLGKADGQGDSAVIDGTNGNDTITASLLAGAVSIKGLPVQVSIAQVEAIDSVSISGGGGNDSISVAAIPAKAGQFFLDGEEGNDKVTGNLGNNVLYGSEGNDTLSGGGGHDTITGGEGNDTITGGAGKDTIAYTSILDGHDVVIGFDGNPAGGQDTLDLEQLFDGLGVLAADRAGRVFVQDKGATVDVFVDADGIAGFELAVATLKTADVVTVGVDILVGT